MSYTVKKTINGVEYEAQFAGLSVALQLADYISENNSKNANQHLADFVFEHIIVTPKNLTADSFDDWNELTEVISWARDVAQGFHKPKADTAADKAKGEK